MFKVSQRKFVKDINVLFIWDLPQIARKTLVEQFSDIPQVNFLFAKDYSRTSQELKQLLPRADVIVGWRPPNDLFQNAKKVKLYINPGTGVQRIISIFREVNKTRKVVLVNGHGHAYPCAQHAVAMLLTLLNKIIPHHNWLSNGQWRKNDSDAATIPLKSRKIGLLGYGAINSWVHRFLSGFKVEFSALRKNWDKQTETPPTTIKKFLFPELHEFLKEIDTLIIAAPLTSQTEGMIRLEELKFLGHDGLLVNVGRGAIIDEESLYTALYDNIIAGAAIDVLWNYSPKEDSDGKKYPFSCPFQNLSNVVLSPHRAASPMVNFPWDEVIENIKRMAEDRTDFLNIVDLKEGY